MSDDKQHTLIMIAGAIAGVIVAILFARLFGDDGDDDRGGDTRPPKVPPSLEVLAEGQRRKKAKIERGGFKPRPKKDDAPATPEPAPATA